MFLSRGILLLIGFIVGTRSVDVLLECETGWTRIGVNCYRLYPGGLPWDSAERVCRCYGSHLVKVKDYYENDEIGNFVNGTGTIEYWTGVTRQGTAASDERALLWSDGMRAAVAVGYWSNFQPNTTRGQCVASSIAGPRVRWQLQPCEQKTAYVCQRSAAPAGSFHCVNGQFVRRDLTCDGDDDCADGSDEINCAERCHFDLRDSNGTITSPNYPNEYPTQANCLWRIQAPLGYNIRLQFKDFSTESQSDVVSVLAGGLTLANSRQMAMLSGVINSSALPVYTSNNNFMIVTFSTDFKISNTGFRAVYSTVKAEDLPQPMMLTAINTPQDLSSPLYPAEYLSSQDYTWIIQAEQRRQLVTLEIVEVDLKGSDRILIRDGDSVSSNLVTELTSSGGKPPYVLSTGRSLYITMQTRGLVTGKGFRFRYWQGCRVQRTGTSGELHSPGFNGDKGQYGEYQSCTYDVIVPPGQTVSVVFNYFDVHPSDVLRVYMPGNKTLELRGTTLPSSITFNDSFKMEFISDAITVSRGFSLTYSIACSAPVFNAQTSVTSSDASMTSAVSAFNLGTSVAVSCVAGYTFYAAEHRNTSVEVGFAGLDRVTMTCIEGGRWDVHSLPRCEPRYCGKAPPVPNAYISQSTGVTYQATVRYECYPGFSLTGSSTIMCSSHGVWTTVPSCTTSSCPAQPMTIPNGAFNVTSGDGTSFGSILEYSCSRGYQLAGSPILFCGSSGSWSASPPTCQALTCLVPTIPRATVTHSGTLVTLGTSVTATCTAGYVTSLPGGSLTVTCDASRTFQGLLNLTCTFQDRCVSEPGYCSQLCQDSMSEGRKCSCNLGYSLATDGRTCTDIDECQVGNGGCDQICKNIAGSYQCECRSGYKIFANNGDEGFTVAWPEDGKRAGDIRRLHHSCVPVRCPTPPVVAGGKLLVDKSSYHFQDHVEYLCELGFQLQGSDTLTCLASGQWDLPPPVCQVATCPPDKVSTNLKNPARLSTTGSVQFGHNVTLTCDVPGRGTVSKYRWCVYYQGRYQLAGAHHECGFVECGRPKNVSGSQNVVPSSSVYGASFQFVCQNLYTILGNSSQGDRTVRCTNSGIWDFGDLRCEGARCDDPGRPPDGTQVATSYNQGELVSFRCSRPGFTLSNPHPIQCQMNPSGSGLSFNASVPTCQDTQAPTLSGCNTTLEASRYARLSDVVSIPTAQDNTGVKMFKIREGPVTSYPSSKRLLSKDLVVFNFTASDYNNNEAHCTTTVVMKDDVPPTIEGPPNIVREFRELGETITVMFTANDVTVSDNKGTREPEFTPSKFIFTASASVLSTSFPPTHSQMITAAVQDLAGNSASCQFPLVFRPAKCSPLSLREPVHGKRNCSRKSDNSGYQCELSCEPGYVFYDQGSDKVIVKTCNDGDNWQGPPVPACVSANQLLQEALFRQTFRFNYTQMDGSAPCTNMQQYIDRIVSSNSLADSVKYLPEVCVVSESSGKRPTGTLTITNVRIYTGYVLIDYTLTYDRRNSQIYAHCKEAVKLNYEGDVFIITESLRQNFTPISCPAISATRGGRFVMEEYFCPVGKLITWSGKQVCVSCSEGMRSVSNNTCEVCLPGTYNQNTGQWATCTNCPAGTSTQPGAVSSSECTAMCSLGTYSATGLPPCQMCPKNTYGVNSTYCAPCASGHVTRTSGSTSASQCLAPCPVGTYNVIDGHGSCSPCPANFYSSQVGAQFCTECSGDTYTTSTASTTQSACVEFRGCTAKVNPCQNGGTCSIVEHTAVCTCLEGFVGELCELPIHRCASSPCYNGGSCTVDSTGNPQCSCPAGSSGSRCEVITKMCQPDTCQNGGACRNELNSFTCLCPPGYSGNRCQTAVKICEPNPCENGGTCQTFNNIRYQCHCSSGYQGDNCQLNIDDCASNPCLHGGNCTDLVGAYQCTCPPGRYTGPNCETRISRCSPSLCGPGQCVEDHLHDTFRCICKPGSAYGVVCQFEAYFGFEVNSSVKYAYVQSGVTVTACLEMCEEVDCSEVMFDNATLTCRLVDPADRVPSVAAGSHIYYIRQCQQVEEYYWTPWYDTFLPGDNINSGDDEQRSSLMALGLNICEGTLPVEAQCQTVRNGTPPTDVLDVACTPDLGLLCLNQKQSDQRCDNYEIRFKCLSSRVPSLAASSCQAIDYCSNSSVCNNNGTCSSMSTEAACDCYPGFTGSRCQHHVDDCSASPGACLNGATCRDLHGSYACDCAPGYTGSHCETNIDDCSAAQCSLSGTQGCVDQVNDYLCDCRAGYTGRQCEVNIDDCASMPCLHGSTCIDRVNGFHCTCPAGWEGDRCQVMVKPCQSSPCSNSAACLNLFADFFCSCLPNTYGKTCSSASSVCASANPCLHGGQCVESSGMAMCQCTSEYDGEGCEIQKDVCSGNQTVCHNGGTCVSTSSGSYSCRCMDGYSGPSCERNIDDCAGNTCPASSTCIDMVNTHFCRCPVGFSGDHCDKGLLALCPTPNLEDQGSCFVWYLPFDLPGLGDPARYSSQGHRYTQAPRPRQETAVTFDLKFSLPDKNNIASLGYPIHLKGTGFTITLWIKYTNRESGLGTIFTAFQVPQANSLAGKREILRLDRQGLVVSLDGTTRRLNSSVDYFKDGAWHYIAISWSATTGLFSFFVDTIRNPIYNYNTAVDLDMYVWLALGCHYNVTSDTCTKGDGYNGYVSQVSLYNRELRFTEELTVIGNRDPFARFPGVLMTWGEFLLYPGVTRVYPTHVDASCPQGFTTTPSCTTPVPGKQMVSVSGDTCPKDIILYSNKRVTQVTWAEPTFSGSASSVVSALSSGSVFLWGKYRNIILATNRDGNQALCTFDIYVQYDQCSTPTKPLNTDQVFCANFTDDEKRGYRQCSLNCMKDYTPVLPAPYVYTCGPVGTWDPPNMYRRFTLPPCGKINTPTRRVIATIAFEVPSLECVYLRNELARRVTGVLMTENSAWSKQLCRAPDCSDIPLNISCQTNRPGRRKRQATHPTSLTVSLSIDNAPTRLTSTNDSSTSISPENLLQLMTLTLGRFDFRNYIAEAVPNPDTSDIQIRLQCPAPQGFVDNECVDCSPGSYYDNTTMSCMLCPVGKYQARYGHTTCDTCSIGTTTESTGSSSSQDCKRSCPAGQMYDVINETCIECAQGFYQNNSGQFFCYPCPVDKTTRQTGANSSSLCFNDCPPGEELTENGSCTPCTIGFYKPSGETLCGPCPVRLVTNYTGAQSLTDCNVADNRPGFIRLRPDETRTMPCPIGTYQHQKWQYTCISCGGPNYRTDLMAATSPSDCKFFCPAGQEQDGHLEACKPCDVGFYRTGENPYSRCELCPNNTRTDTTGAFNMSQCSIFRCPAGQVPTSNQTSCVPCPRGTYQPKKDATDCIRCAGDKMDTRLPGATSDKQCEVFCDSGYEKLSNGSCSICAIGFFKNNSINTFQSCTRCSDPRFVTPHEGAVGEMLCTVLNCTEGTRINYSKRICEECPLGTYQDEPYQTSCKNCSAGMSTRNNGTRLASDCETFCQNGFEKNLVTHTCDECQRGFYKNNNNYLFMDCTLCPPEYVTLNNGSSQLSDCIVRNCTPGQYIAMGGNNCNLCDYGLYQPYWWQSQCLKCPEDRTTQRLGAVSLSECILSCPPGKENKPGAYNCTPCEQGFYKSREAAAACDKCPARTTTRDGGATDQSECDQTACEAGSFPSKTDPKMCAQCPFATYQPLRWQQECIRCPAGYTNLIRGATSNTSCILDCPAGQQYLENETRCEKCPIGFYNTDLNPESSTCILCSLDLITPSTGSTSERDCTIRNCTLPGQYRDPLANECRDCPRGQWQDQKWQTGCMSCPPGTTTRTQAATSEQDCQHDCAEGMDLRNGQCEKCRVGEYRNKTQSWECQPCPAGLTTQTSGSPSLTDCNLSTCPAGMYFDNTMQRCAKCPANTYQNEPGSFECKKCPLSTQTSPEGSTQLSRCIDKCQTSANNCSKYADCTSSDTGIRCSCKPRYLGDGFNCTHICVHDGYCKNGGSCVYELAKCECTDHYTGDRCDLRKDALAAGLSEKDVVITAVVATLAFLLFIIIVVVCCCVLARRRQRTKVPLTRNDSEERGSIATRMSVRNVDDFTLYATKPTTTFTTGPRMLLPMQGHQVYENPTYVFNTDGDPAVYKA